ncbi:hypothetical protein OUZ56_029353 [Daphnia magna]|uniref:Uncharacterized protein n=1 Tax=Daphnia magna TaxID=35525 RepID=A0ABR0B6J9_9CRUS|nr:hypothetical protein OUZ56_029353 [Daphnia magna]
MKITEIRSFLMGKPTLRLRRHTVSIALLPWQLKHSKRPQNTKNQKVYQLPPLSPTVYKNNVDKEIITRNNNFGACVDVVSNFYSSFRA